VNERGGTLRRWRYIIVSTVFPLIPIQPFKLKCITRVLGQIITRFLITKPSEATVTVC